MDGSRPRPACRWFVGYEPPNRGRSLHIRNSLFDSAGHTSLQYQLDLSIFIQGTKDYDFDI